MPAHLRAPAVLTALLAAGWLYLWVDWLAFHQRDVDEQRIGFGLSLLPVLWWLNHARNSANPVFRYVVYSFCLFPVWHLLVFIFDELGSDAPWGVFRVYAAQGGLFLAFVTGLGWVTWWVDRKARALQLTRLEASGAATSAGPLQAMHQSVAGPAEGVRIWNPFDMDAWYYGRQRQKLRQSLSVLFSYLLLFILLVVLLLQMSGCRELYELPAGGGEEKPPNPVVKVQKVKIFKIIFNPLSKLIAEVPPLKELELQLMEETRHTYTVGSGEGAGAGFSAGTNRGRARFIRLEYAGGDWDQRIDADLNMLLQYNLRTQHKTAPRPETRKIAQLKNFPVGKSPPFVYLTGQKNISVGKNETEILREYLLEKHGMLFADNAGSAHWGNQFKSLMSRILPEVAYITVPLDHPIHRNPFAIPPNTYVSPHGGKDPLAWVVNGRIVAYYHPGDIGDAWKDDHSGVATHVWEACFLLGTNVMFYAHAEYSKWLTARKKKAED